MPRSPTVSSWATAGAGGGLAGLAAAAGTTAMAHTAPNPPSHAIPIATCSAAFRKKTLPVLSPRCARWCAPIRSHRAAWVPSLPQRARHVMTLAGALPIGPTASRTACGGVRQSRTMPKITFVGAGSTVFAKNLLGDILSLPELAESTVVLFDIDDHRLQTSEIVARRTAEAVGARPQLTATTDRRAALDGADYVVAMFQVAGYRPGTVIDFEVPRRYGLRQTIADTLGVGGIMRGLRTIPVILDLCREMEEL